MKRNANHLIYYIFFFYDLKVWQWDNTEKTFLKLIYNLIFNSYVINASKLYYWKDWERPYNKQMNSLKAESNFVHARTLVISDLYHRISN